jgi:hypothetical protein
MPSKAALEATPLLLPSNYRRQQPKSRIRSVIVWIIFLIAVLGGTAATLVWPTPPSISELPPFHSRIRTPQGICNADNGKGVSHAGYIGLDGDSNGKPKRSFFW